MAFGVGLLGVGTVGGGVAELLLKEGNLLKRRTGGLEIRLVAAADLNRSRLAPLAEAGVETFCDARSVISHPGVDVLVELIGGLEPARSLVLESIRAGKPVVTANKALLAVHGREIAKAAQEKGIPVGFGASVCGGVPVILALRKGLVANDIYSVVGIVNGTCNYILTKMSRGGVSYERALKEAQDAGYAEADPSLDVEGTDSAHKLAILAMLAFRTPVELAAISCEGISSLDVADIRFANELGYVVKLLAVGKRTTEGLDLRVHPTLLASSHPLASVSDVFNAVEISGHAVGKVMFQGRGAGRMPTASTVVADIVEMARLKGVPVRDPSIFWESGECHEKVLPPGESRSRFYVRFTVRDEYGVLGKIARVLGEHKVSIASVIQKEPPRDAPPGGVPIVMLTHQAREADFRAALEEIDRFDFVMPSRPVPAGDRRKSVFLRVEEA